MHGITMTHLQQALQVIGDVKMVISRLTIYQTEIPNSSGMTEFTLDVND
jgi:hypothetical protein